MIEMKILWVFILLVGQKNLETVLLALGNFDVLFFTTY